MRKKRRNGFEYYLPNGRKVGDRKTLERIALLVIPPAWTNVWISLKVNSHLQASGFDAKGRKQYIYHAEWTRCRDHEKYRRLFDFAKCLPAIREQVEKDLRKRGLPRDKVLATVVRLLETTCIRVGNETYARANESYGLTTLRAYHVDVKKCDIRFKFKGKSGKEHDVQLTDCMLANIVRHCKGKPKELLFQYTNAQGQNCKVTSADVNRYLKEVSGRDITAKDFRTWWGTLLAALLLNDVGAAASATATKRNIQAAIKEVASHLGNTPAVCRSSYVNPYVLEAYEQGRCMGRIMRNLKTGKQGVLPEEQAFIRFLKAEYKRERTK